MSHAPSQQAPRPLQQYMGGDYTESHTDNVRLSITVTLPDGTVYRHVVRDGHALIQPLANSLYAQTLESKKRKQSSSSVAIHADGGSVSPITRAAAGGGGSSAAAAAGAAAAAARGGGAAAAGVVAPPRPSSSSSSPGAGVGSGSPITITTTPTTTTTTTTTSNTSSPVTSAPPSPSLSPGMSNTGTGTPPMSALSPRGSISPRISPAVSPAPPGQRIAHDHRSTSPASSQIYGKGDEGEENSAAADSFSPKLARCDGGSRNLRSNTIGESREQIFKRNQSHEQKIRSELAKWGTSAPSPGTSPVTSARDVKKEKKLKDKEKKLMDKARKKQDREFKKRGSIINERSSSRRGTGVMVPGSRAILYGASLQVAIANNKACSLPRHRRLLVPAAIEVMLDEILMQGLGNEKLFIRPPPDTVRALGFEVDALRLEITKANFDAMMSVSSVQVLINALMEYFEELPQPLLGSCVQDLKGITELTDETMKIDFVRSALGNADKHAYNLTKRLLTFFWTVSNNCHVANITPESIAANCTTLFFGPLLAINPMDAANEMHSRSQAVTFMIRHYALVCDEDERLAQDVEKSRNFKELSTLLSDDTDGFIITTLFKATDTTAREKLCRDIVLMFKDTPRLQKILRGIIREEVAGATMTTLFRSNSVSSHLLTQFTRMVGTRYLRTTLSPLIRDLVADLEADPTISFEIDPSRLVEGEVVETNQAQLLDRARRFMKSIMSSMDACPMSLRRAYVMVRHEVAQRFPEESQTSSVGGFFFLRFMGPAMISPDGNGIVDRVLEDKARRCLVLISKTIQNISNRFTKAKEEYMSFSQPFITEWIPVMSEFLEQLASSDHNHNSPASVGSMVLQRAEATRSRADVLLRINHALLTKVDAIKRAVDEKLETMGPEEGAVLSRRMEAVYQKLTLLGTPPPLLFLSHDSAFDRQAPKMVTKLLGHQSSVLQIAVDQKGINPTVLTADSRGAIISWDLTTPQYQQTLPYRPSGAVLDLVLIGPNAIVASATGCAVVDSVTGEMTKELSRGAPCLAICFVGDAVWVSYDHKIVVYDHVSFELKCEITMEHSLLQLIWVGGNTVWGTTDRGRLIVLDAVSTPFVMREVESDTTTRTNDMIAVGENVWTAGQDGSVSVYNSRTFTLAKKMIRNETEGGKLFGLCSFGSVVWSCSWNLTIQIWDRDTFDLVTEVKVPHRDAVKKMVAVWNSAMGEWFAWLGSMDSNISVMRIPDGDRPPFRAARVPRPPPSSSSSGLVSSQSLSPSFLGSLAPTPAAASTLSSSSPSSPSSSAPPPPSAPPPSVPQHAHAHAPPPPPSTPSTPPPKPTSQLRKSAPGVGSRTLPSRPPRKAPPSIPPPK